MLVTSIKNSATDIHFFERIKNYWKDECLLTAYQVQIPEQSVVIIMMSPESLSKTSPVTHCK